MTSDVEEKMIVIEEFGYDDFPKRPDTIFE